MLGIENTSYLKLKTLSLTINTISIYSRNKFIEPQVLLKQIKTLWWKWFSWLLLSNNSVEVILILKKSIS